jgi:nitroreductase
MLAEIGLFEAMYSARALRKLKPDPVPEDLLTKILDAAIRAPSAGNAQNWVFVVVRDPEQRRLITTNHMLYEDEVKAVLGLPDDVQTYALMPIGYPRGKFGPLTRLGVIYRKAADIVGAIYAARGRPPHMSEEQYRRFMSAGSYLWDHIAEAPVLLIACLKREQLPPPSTLPPAVRERLEDEREYVMRRAGASIYPAVQNIGAPRPPRSYYACENGALFFGFTRDNEWNSGQVTCGFQIIAWSYTPQTSFSATFSNIEPAAHTA